MDSLIRATPGVSSLIAAPLPLTGCGASGTIADKSGFEGADGNLAIDKAGCMDWNGFAPLTWTGSVPYQNATKTSGNFTFFGVSDAFNSQTDTSYAGGVKQADECPATGTGSVNNKSDLARVYLAVSTDPATKHVYLDLAWVRAPLNTTSSDVHVGFEFNQNKTPCASGSTLVHRTPGDILLVYNFQSGSASIAYSQWTGSAWTPETTLSSSIAEAAVFGGTSTSDTIKPPNGLDPAADEFGEAGIDLTAATASLGNNGRACEHFGTAFGESRTSGSSTSAQMKDIVGPANIDISNCATPGLTTTQLPASGAMGATFKDSATLSGATTPDGTGSITFKLYSAADCGGSVLDTETVTGINANGDYTTPTGYVIENAGTYYWVASFSGDGLNNATTSGCNDEPVEVAKANPSVSTTQHPATGSAGEMFKDTATLSAGGHYDGTGTITFTLYSAADCGGSVLDSETVDDIAANGDYTTPVGVEIDHAGTYYWVASFSGDPNNLPFTSDCNDEPVVVNQPSIKIVKTADAAQVSVGDPIGFTLTVSNAGPGDANGVRLSDPLPTKPGLSWTIASQGAGWGGSCAITAGMLHCGPVTVPAGTTQAASTFTVHVISPTTKATGGFCPGGGGVVDNTGTVTSTNGGSDESEASTCVGGIDLHILKTADVAQASTGDQIGFTLTVWNLGTGDAKGVRLSDPLPTNAGLSWTIESQGAGWGGSCAIAAGTLTCGPVTVPAGTTQAASTFTVHIISTTTSATGGDCPGSGVVDNTGFVTATNGGPDQSEASTCVAGAAIHILKTADAAQVNAGDQIGFTLTVFNSGGGDAKGVSLSDTLPTNPGLSWTIESQGAGWGGSCAITAGTLTCGPATVPAGTTQAASTFTVHIISTTTSATGGACPGSGVVDNTGSVTTTNDGSDQSEASTCVAAAAIHILKTADAAEVNAGDPIGFTLTVSNSGAGDALGVTLSDPLPTNPGLSWTIESQGAGWGGTCAITAGTLTCGPVTVPAGTTPEESTFTVHITSTTTPATGGPCPGTGVVDNTGSVTTANDGSDQSEASTCVALTDLQITKSASWPGKPNPDRNYVPNRNITWTMVVTNNGPLVDTNVTVNDPMPAGNTYVSSQTTKGSCTGGALLTCDLGTLQVNESVTITLVTRPAPTFEGLTTNTATVAGDLPETTLANNTASASVLVVGLRPPLVCTKVHVNANAMFVAGHATTVYITVTRGHRRVKGVRVRIAGAGIAVVTKRSNAKGRIVQTITPVAKGHITFRPILPHGQFSCGTPTVPVSVFARRIEG